eukprot:5021829-Amphidinium_carterae.1
MAKTLVSTQSPFFDTNAILHKVKVVFSFPISPSEPAVVAHGLARMHGTSYGALDVAFGCQ